MFASQLDSNEGLYARLATILLCKSSCSCCKLLLRLSTAITGISGNLLSLLLWEITGIFLSELPATSEICAVSGNGNATLGPQPDPGIGNRSLRASDGLCSLAMPFPTPGNRLRCFDC